PPGRVTGVPRKVSREARTAAERPNHSRSKCLNANRLPERAIDKVGASIQEFGWRQAIVVDKDGIIICGHTRLLAAKKLGLKQVPVHVAANLTPAQVKAYRLMDNRSHEEAEWDTDLLGPELEELRDLDFDLSLTGFDPNEIEDFLADPEADD